jgi:hypothetical protein
MLTEEQQAYIEAHPSAAMITVGRDGYAKPARVAVTLVDGRLLSSGTADRVRTRRLRRDPRCTLFVFGTGYQWLGLDTDVTLLEGPDAIDLTVRMFRRVQAKPEGPLSWFGTDHEEPAFRDVLVNEGRLLYEFDVVRAYGMA